jgi:N-methylhydantoinase A/oxoprolinase/acetone carboxylase beta subunit/N-methylhydantoinase B/oxoprolinase/acetone carboxylase alpha subunit
MTGSGRESGVVADSRSPRELRGFLRVALDAGGTFTDGVVLADNGETLTAKSHTTPEDPGIGTMNCLGKLATLGGMSLRHFLGRTKTIVHGTTLATNVVASKAGPKIGTITTKGFRDRLTFQQVAKDEYKEAQRELFDFRLDAPQPLTRRHLMTEVEERVNYLGTVLTPLNEEDVRKAVAHLKKHGVESIAVLLLFSHENPAHERRIAEIIKDEWPEVDVALSSQVVPIMGEVERWSTTMFSAYVAPKVRFYVSRIQEMLKTEGFKGELVFVQNNGGLATPSIVMENPASLMLSGPAAGPRLGLYLGAEQDTSNIVTVDMGGTSCDVGVVSDGKVDIVPLQIIEAKKFALPSVDVNAVGAGGGSVAWVDLTGRLQVGPKSAGASPGPACYGAGGEEATVTDADVVLGYIDPQYFLGGETRLRKDLAENAIREKIAKPLNMTVTEAAAAIHDVINATMASAIDVSFAQRGYDPRDFTLCAAGGAAPVHAVRLIGELGIRRLMVPKVAPIFCAFGMLFTDLKHDFTRPYFAQTAAADLKRINELYAEMEQQAREILSREAAEEKDIVVEKSMDMRYYGQFREKSSEVPAGPVTQHSLNAAVRNFHDIHRASQGYSDERYPTEIIRLHLTASAKVERPQVKEIEQGTDDASEALKGTRKAYFAELKDYVETKIYDGEKIRAGNVLQGPCIIEEKLTNLVVPPNVKMSVDRHGTYTAELQKATARQIRRAGASAESDPTTFAVVWNRLDFISKQIGRKILYAAQSFVTANVRDLGQTISDAKGRIVTAASFIPEHTFVAHSALKGIRETFGDDYKPGDFIIANHPYIVKTGHLPDWNFVRPIFYKGEHVGFLQAKTHVSDTGGHQPSGYAPRAHDIIAEGLNIRPLKFVASGIRQDALWAFLLDNVRNARAVEMDAMLINGALAQAEEQIVALMDKYGKETVTKCMDQIVEAGERMMRAEIAKIPDGTYYAEAAADWDGVTDKEVWVRAKVTVKGDEIIADLTDSDSDKNVTFINCPLGMTECFVMTGIFYLINPAVPKNSGAMVPIKILTKKGTVVDPKYPCTIGASGVAVGCQIGEAVMLALGQANPEGAMAAWTKHCCPINVGVESRTIDPRTGEPKVYWTEHFASDGGSGALKGHDGWQGIAFIGVAGEFMRPNVEMYEANDIAYRMLDYAALQDWEGAGEFRGAPGTYTATLADLAEGDQAWLMTGNSDGEKQPPRGVAGGRDAPTVKMFIEDTKGNRRVLRTMDQAPIYAAEKFITYVPGGGGWGDPLNRDIQRVLDDVVDDYVSVQRARDVYGVVVDPKTFHVDYAATEALRNEKKAKRKEQVQSQ